MRLGASASGRPLRARKTRSAAAAAPVQQPAAPVPPAPPADPVIAEMDDKAAVSNGDWELLERIFSRKK